MLGKHKFGEHISLPVTALLLDKGLSPQDAEGGVKYPYDFYSETTGQILMKLGHYDHLVVGIRIYT